MRCSVGGILRSTLVSDCPVPLIVRTYALTWMPHVPSGLLCHVTSADILHKIRMSPKPVGYETHASSQSITSGARAIEQVEGAIEKLAFRFNQVRTYVLMYVCTTD